VDEGGQLVAHFLLPWLRVVRFGSFAVAIVSALLIVLQCHGDDGSISDMSGVLVWRWQCGTYSHSLRFASDKSVIFDNM